MPAPVPRDPRCTHCPHTLHLLPCDHCSCPTGAWHWIFPDPDWPMTED